ncbi:hypothetical protein Y696_02495 [Mesotoga sp. H07pep.5.4]|uniref:DUF2207 domain-containing protein n=1 Tax=Mesotoga sp. H07pep.5.4 TaxID=1463664 RepID=UPI000EF15466|nr:DUF2207 domain-containing protein [Mesotoga sp. H07pep.5.4]RLL86971.1 hypothetical protein Y696_02495 [Mesotoga sp. H07pep.5.4]
MKKIVTRVIIGLIIGLITWGIVVIVFSGGISDTFSSITSIEKADVLMEIDENGLLTVTETIDYVFKKPYRGIYRELPADRAGSQYSEIEVTAVGKEIKYIESFGSQDARSVRIWFVPYNTGAVSPVKGEERVSITYKYTVRRAVEVGTDIAQIFRKIWGEDTASWVKEITATIVFPENLEILEFYTHPVVEVDREGNTYELEATNVPPLTYVEFRAVIPKDQAMAMNMRNVALGGAFDKNYIDGVESEVRRKILFGKWIIPIAIGLLTPFVLIFAHRKLGREIDVGYYAEYERDLPTQHAPDVINAAVKNLAGMVDNDGIGSTIMELYRREYIDFEKGKGDKVEGIVIKNRNVSKLRPTEAAFLEFLDKYDTENVFDFSAVKKTVTKKQSEARIFTSDFSKYKTKVHDSVKGMHLIDLKGNAIVKGYSIVMFVVCVILLAFYSGADLAPLRIFSLIFFGAIWVLSWIMMVLPKDVFGRWTREGRLFYLKWLGLKNYLEDYSLLNEKPPESIILWEEYLVYATALGIADTVRKNLNKIVPEDVWNEQSRHPYMYYPVTAYAVSSFTGVTRAAYSASSKGSGGGGGFSGGGSGGGGGGGGTGGF